MRTIRIITPNLSYKDGLNELNLPTLVDTGDFLCKRFYEKNFGSSSNISDFSCYLSGTHIHIILETLGTLHFLRHAQVVFIIVSFPRVCENKWDLPYDL